MTRVTSLGRSCPVRSVRTLAPVDRRPSPWCIPSFPIVSVPAIPSHTGTRVHQQIEAGDSLRPNLAFMSSRVKRSGPDALATTAKDLQVRTKSTGFKNCGGCAARPVRFLLVQNTSVKPR